MPSSSRLCMHMACSTPPDDYYATWETVRKDLMWVPGKRKADRVASSTPGERIEATKVGYALKDV
eukprot:1147711-Pelagomonas_calceolata.AAC.3